MAEHLQNLWSKLLTTQSREHVREMSIVSLIFASQDTGGTETGAVSLSDIRRFAPPSTLLQLNTPVENIIVEELESTLLSISHLWLASGQESYESHPSIHNLPHHIEERMDEIKTTEAAVESAQDRIQLLFREIGQIHPRLQERLSHALNKFPLDISRQRAANDDLLAMTIEASLVKVSFMRAQALGMLYDHRSSQNPGLTMRGALKGAYAKLQAEEREMEEEECKLDRELTEYQTLLDMVDGGGRGGFRQIVADFARVEKETEECKKDLRRLGWTREDS